MLLPSPILGGHRRLLINLALLTHDSIWGATPQPELGTMHRDASAAVSVNEPVLVLLALGTYGELI
ncbi:MAG: hypothetical protein C4K47_08170 [Candidatus Thorarchaeota archaeon]|nr:MAG: hypothetical protein C4K47_08170 [Candidatus Thorarchaeota archaeon]